MPLEIERKFKIKILDFDNFLKDANKVIEVSQTYLKSSSTLETRRVRKSTVYGKSTYYFTHKKDITSYVREENEKEISLLEYNSFLEEAITPTLSKTRYCINYDKYMLEIDIYPFWKDFAILEIENLKKGELFNIPKYIEIIEEVTEDKSYSNFEIANHLSTLLN
ncbi:MAG TPA: hypothetical protein GX709_01800 [Clostridiales bacterium]|nr:hypothetical protein [Clostridiales bacterium]